MSINQWDHKRHHNQTPQNSETNIFYTNGVPQGSVLGPTLFLVYVNDCANELNCDVAMFADDIKIWSTIRSEVDEVRLQTNLDRLEQWSKDWLLPFNVNKCTFLRVGRTSSPNHTVYRLTGKPLQEVDAQKDLGVWITTSLKPSLQCSKVAKSAMSMLYLVKRAFSSFDEDCFAKTSGDVEISEDGEKAEHISQFFKSIFTSESPFTPPDYDFDEGPKIESVSFDEATVRKELMTLNESKSPGPDDKPPKLLKELAAELAKPLSMLFQASFEAGGLPADWKSARITPLHKGGSKASAKKLQAN
nr:unnamed protein product [Spirometra erinaceieuropaei]